MKYFCLAGIALLVSSPLFGQSLEELQRRLAEKDFENQQLRERVKMLEREVTSRTVPPAHAQRVAPSDDDDINRALERGLVRERGLLLSPQTFELETNFVYSHFKSNTSAFRRDSFGPGLALRMGLPWRSQLEVALPYVFERRHSDTFSTNANGIGDLTVGVSHQFLSERPAPLSLIGNITYQASTGKNTVFESMMPVALGSGFDSVQAGFTAVKRIDPLVYFGGYNFTHTFSKNKSGTSVAPGDSHGLRFGTALATSPTTSLRAAFSVNFFEKTKIGETSVAGSDDPVALLEIGGSVVLNASTALDVLVGAGLTKNAPDFRLSVALPIRF